MLSALSSALSGYTAASTQLDVFASNIANLSSTQSTDSTGKTANVPYVPQRVIQSSLQGGGVSANTRPVSPASIARYDPSDPAANAQGVVQTPNVDLVQQIVGSNVASCDAQANLKMTKVQDEMTQAALNILS
jgi:flagellar basal-body rod protein FlgC